MIITKVVASKPIGAGVEREWRGRRAHLPDADRSAVVTFVPRNLGTEEPINIYKITLIYRTQ